MEYHMVSYIYITYTYIIWYIIRYIIRYISYRNVKWQQKLWASCYLLEACSSWTRPFPTETTADVSEWGHRGITRKVNKKLMTAESEKNMFVAAIRIAHIMTLHDDNI